MSQKIDLSQFKRKESSESENDDKVDLSQFKIKQPSRAKSLISAPIKGLGKGLQTVNPLDFFSPFSQEAGENILEQLLPTQDKEPEKFLERAGQLAPAAALGPEGLGMKALQTAGGALAGHLAKEEGFGEGAQLTSEIIGMSFPGLLKSLGLKVVSAMKKGFKTSSGEQAAKALRLKPEQVKNEVIAAAERLGVEKELPISAQTTNPAIQSIETKLMQSTTGAPIQEKIERAGEKLKGTYKESLKTISSRENMLPSVVAEEATTALKNIEEGNEKAYKSLYAQARKSLPEDAKTAKNVGMAINKVLDSTLKNLNSSMGTTSKDALFNRLTRLKNRWATSAEIKEGLIPIQELQDLKIDLGQVIKYETKGGMDKMLTGLLGVTKEGIKRYGKDSNPQYLNRFNQAEKRFGENAKTFRKNAVMKALVEAKNPEMIFGKMNTVKGINEMEKVFAKTPEGKEIFDAAKRYKLEDLMNKKVLDKNGDISWGKAAGMFKEPKTRDLAIKLLGTEQYKKLRDLSVVASGVEEGFKKFVNTSKSTSTAMDMALLVALPIKAAQQTFTKNYLGAARTVGAILMPNQLAKLLASPEFVEAAIRTGKAGKGSNPKKFFEAAQRVAQLTATQMARIENEISEPQEPESTLGID